MTQIDMMAFSKARLAYETAPPLYRGEEVVRLWKGPRRGYVWCYCNVYDLGRTMDPEAGFPEWETEIEDFPSADAINQGRRKKLGRPRGVLTSERHQQIVDYLQEHGESTAREIADHYGWPRGSATRTLRDNPHCVSRRDRAWSVAGVFCGGWRNDCLGRVVRGGFGGRVSTVCVDCGGGGGRYDVRAKMK